MCAVRPRQDRLSPCAGVVVEALDIVHVLSRHVERLVPRLGGHLEDAGAIARRGRQTVKGAPFEAMAGEGFWRIRVPSHDDVSCGPPLNHFPVGAGGAEGAALRPWRSSSRSSLS